MKILITGHKGFIGQNIWNHFAGTNELIGYDWDENVRPKVKGCDAVIHLGAISSTTERDIDKILRQNFDFSKWLFKECVKHDVVLQYASSASVYGNNTDFQESSKLSPSSPYAWSKFLFDRWVNDQKSANPIQGYRYFNVYGPHEDHKNDQASPVHKFSKQAKETGKIKLFKGSEAYKRDFVFVGDLCLVHEKMLNKQCSGIFNAGTGNAVSFKKVAKAIAKKFNAEIELIEMPESLKSQYQKYTCADISALLQHIEMQWTDITKYIHTA